MVPIRYFVVKHGHHWRVELDNTYQNGFKVQKEAVEAAIAKAREMAGTGRKVQVLLQKENNIWYTEWTDEDI